MPTRRDMLQDFAQERGPGGSEPDRADISGANGPRGRTPAATAGSWSSSSSMAATTRSIRSCRLPTKDTRRTARCCASPTKELIRVNDRVGLHPGLRDLGGLLDRGQLALVPGVGYPNPNRSHFESMAIWQTARLDLEEHGGPGWIGRSLDEQAKTGEPPSPPERPSLLHRRGSTACRLARPPRGRRVAGADRGPHIARRVGIAHCWRTRLENQAEPDDSLSAYVRRSLLDAYACSQRVDELTRRKATVAASYPDTALAGKLRTIAQLLKADLGARVFYTSQSGYDTHAGQLNTHYGLLRELSTAIKAFLDDLTAAKLADRVTVMCFSEFGRRVAENGSAGTDHGTAGLVMLAGPGVRPGVHGSVPSLTDLVDGDPKSLDRLSPGLRGLLEIGWACRARPRWDQDSSQCRSFGQRLCEGPNGLS